MDSGEQQYEALKAGLKGGRWYAFWGEAGHYAEGSTEDELFDRTGDKTCFSIWHPTESIDLEKKQAPLKPTVRPATLWASLANFLCTYVHAGI